MAQDINDLLFQTAYRMAIADGELSVNEATVLAVMARVSGITDEQAEVLKLQAASIEIDTLAERLPDRDDQLRLFELACLVALVDGRSDVAEWRLTVRLARALEIDRSQATACLGAALTRLRHLMKRYDLSPEIRERLRQHGIHG
jgi:tellurite resistance protein